MTNNSTVGVQCTQGPPPDEPVAPTHQSPPNPACRDRMVQGAERKFSVSSSLGRLLTPRRCPHKVKPCSSLRKSVGEIVEVEFFESPYEVHNFKSRPNSAANGGANVLTLWRSKFSHASAFLIGWVSERG